MKFRTTKKKILETYYCFKVGYCELQSLLKETEQEIILYTDGAYGWNCDIYIKNDIAITTGYRPFGMSIKKAIPDYEKYEQQALAINRMYTGSARIQMIDMLKDNLYKELLNWIKSEIPKVIENE